MGIREIFQKSRFKKQFSNLWIEDNGLLKVEFSDGSYGFIVSFWVFDLFVFTTKRSDAVKIIQSKNNINDDDILNLFL